MMAFAKTMLGVVGVVACTSLAHAQANKPIRSGAFYEDRASSYASSQLVTLTFGATPSDKFFNITDVSCKGRIPSSSTLLVADLRIGTTSGGNEVGRESSVLGGAYVGFGGDTYFGINTKTFIKIGPSRFPSIYIVTKSGSFNFVETSCVIVGTLTDD